MTQPEYVPIVSGDRVRGAERLPPARSWTASRPGEVWQRGAPEGGGLGHAGPDQGYAWRLARLFDGKLQLASGEHAEDAVAGCLAVATHRASNFGRAPVVYDVEHAFTLWGFLGGAPDELVTRRRSLFDGAAHDYWLQRRLVDLVPDETLRLSPAEVRERLPVWRSVLNLPD